MVNNASQRIDADLVAGNIKKDINIFGVEGELNVGSDRNIAVWTQVGSVGWNRLTLGSTETCRIEGEAYRISGVYNGETMFFKISNKNVIKKYPVIDNNSYDGFIIGNTNYASYTYGNETKILKFNHLNPSSEPLTILKFKRGEMQKKIKYNGNYIFVYKHGDTYDGKIGIVVAKEDGSKFDYIEYNIGSLSHGDRRTYSLYGDWLCINHESSAKYVNVHLKTKEVKIFNYDNSTHIFRIPFIKISDNLSISVSATNNPDYAFVYKGISYPYLKVNIPGDINDDNYYYEYSYDTIVQYQKVIFN